MGDTGLNLQFSPKTYARVQQNPEWLEELLSKLQPSENIEISDRGAEKENNVLNEDINENIEGVEENLIFSDISPSQEKSCWVDAAVKLLLSSVAELQPKLGKTIKLKNNKKMWECIGEKMKEEGYIFSIIQIENKYRGLERSFKRTKFHNAKMGRNRETCSYERELGEFLNDKPSVFPKYIVGSTRKDVLTREDLISALGSSSIIDPMESQHERETSCSTPLMEIIDDNSTSTLSSSKKKSTQDKILEELREIRKHKRQILKAIEQSSERKKEMAEIMRDRNDILRELVNIIREK